MKRTNPRAKQLKKVPILCRYIDKLSKKKLDVLTSISKKNSADFQSFYKDEKSGLYLSRFLVDSSRGPAQVRKTEEKIVAELKHFAIGDERGLFWSRWFTSEITVNGIPSKSTLKEILTHAEKLKVLETADKLLLTHEKNLYPIEMRFNEDNQLTIRISCEERNPHRMLVQYCVGIFIDHGWLWHDSMQILSYQEELDF